MHQPLRLKKVQCPIGSSDQFSKLGIDLAYTDNTDTINGSAFGDVIDAKSGSDYISSGNGSDNITSGKGDDIVFAGNDDDTLIPRLTDSDFPTRIWQVFVAGNYNLYQPKPYAVRLMCFFCIVMCLPAAGWVSRRRQFDLRQRRVQSFGKP